MFPTSSPDSSPMGGWRAAWAAAGLAALGMGGRAAFGVFVSPLNTASGLGLATLSLALASGQLLMGFTQPVIGSWADRAGAARVIAWGALLLAASLALPALDPSAALVFGGLVVSSVAASAVGSNSLLLGPVTRAAGPNAAVAVGIVGAGASAGQLVLGPLLQWLITAHGWQLALLFFASASAIALPLALRLPRTQAKADGTSAGGSIGGGSIGPPSSAW